MNAADLTTGELADALRRRAAGSLPEMAAVELLVEHGHWLRRVAFLDVIEVGAAPYGRQATVDWHQLVERLDNGVGFYDTGSEIAVLAIACSLASNYPVRIGDALASLDERNVRLVADAVLIAGDAR